MMMKDYRLHDVFISYRRYEDREKTVPKGLIIAQAIYDYLTGKGLKVFWDRPEMQPGDFAAQLDWQLAHCPNYIFIATEGAKRFRTGEEDFVARELKTALALYDRSPADRTVVPVFPYQTLAEKQAASEAGPYPEEIQRLFPLHGVELAAAVPSKEELGEILRLVTAVNRSTMWNAGYQWLLQAKRDRFGELRIRDELISLAGRHEDVRFPISVRHEGGDERPLLDAIRDAENHLYLIGAGGIGKTTALLRVMEEAYGEEAGEKAERNRLKGQVPLFIELSRAPDAIPDDRGKEWQVYSGGRSTFIHREIYRQIRRDLRLRQIHEGVLEQIDDVYKADYDVAVRPIANLLGGEKNAPEYLLLLDGLNEVSRREIKKYRKDGEPDFSRSVVSMVLDEIREIMKYKNVRVILTSRTKEEAAFAGNVEFLDLSGVGPETVRRYLADMRVPEKRADAALNSVKLREVLRTPLFLIMYAKLDGEEDLLTAGEIMRLFYHKRSPEHYTQPGRTEAVHTDVKDSSEGAAPASRVTPDMARFILDFILPEIAWRMARAQEFSIRRDRLGDNEDGLDAIIEHALTDERDEGVCGRYGGYVFTEYQTEACGDISEFAGDTVWRLGGLKRAVNAIEHFAVYTLGVLYKSDDRYGFTHHHLRDYFSAAYHIGRLRMAVYLQSRGKGDIARACLDDWRARPLPAMTRQFIGEALGEAHNAPWCDGKGNWHYSVPKEICDRNLLKRAFDIYRDRFDGRDGYGVWNLLQILKEVRADLAGEDLSRLDLTRCEANGHAFGKRGLAAFFDGAKTDDRLFMPAGHTHKVEFATYSPDGRRIVTASRDHTAKVWDADTLQLIGTLSGHTDIVNSAAFSPDGHRIVTTSWDRTAKVWDTDTLQLIGTLSKHTNWVYSAAYSPDGHRIVTASRDHTAKVWDADSLQLIGTLSGHTHIVNSAAYSPDGRRIVTASWDYTAKVWDANSLLPIGTLSGHISIVFSATYSPDGHRIVTASEDGSAKVWNADSLLPIGTLRGHNDRVKTAAYSPDGRRIVTASFDNTAKLWDADSLQPIGTLRGHTDSVNSASYSLDGHRIVTASWDNTAKVWDADTLQLIGTLNWHTSSVNSSVYSPDGHRIITTASEDKTAKVWNADSLLLIGTLSGHDDRVNSAAYSPDGHRIVTASRDLTVKVWDANSLLPISTWFTFAANSLAYNPDGYRIVTDSKDRTAKVCDADTLQLIGMLWRYIYGYCVDSVAYSPDGHKIITASRDNTAKMLDADTLQLIGTFSGCSNSAAYSPDGHRIVTASMDRTAKVWDAYTLQLIGTLSEHTDEVNSAVFSPDNRRIVTASYDKTAKVWDADTLQPIGTLSGHTGSVKSAVYSPDGRRIVTASSDSTVKVWGSESLQPIGTLSGHTGSVNSATFSPDGQRIVTASSDGTVKVWDAETFDCLHTIRNIPGLEVIGVDLRRLHPDSALSPECLARLKEYGAVVAE